MEGYPNERGISLKVDWTYSRSFANEAPLCMQITSRPMILSQDIKILAKYMATLSKRAVEGALCKNNETLDNYVITSYSIHYTKLYDGFGRADVHQPL